MTTGIPEGIRASAAALGMPAEWLATYISYETGGTFDPMKAGPTTKWGQHRGLIQFGEPQALQYGVNWEDPVGTQLGPDGAVVKYFRDRGWKSGMSFLDGYSIINSGGPGRYSATDAHAGGAAGTVSEKVAGMKPHYDKAVALLGGEVDPSAYNSFLSDAFNGAGEASYTSASTAIDSVRDPSATASSDRDRQRGSTERRSPYYEAMRVSYVQPVRDRLSDPNRDGVVHQANRVR